MPKVEITREKIVEVLESKSPKSLTDIYRHLGGAGKLSGSTAGKIRNLVPDIEKVMADNKANILNAQATAHGDGSATSIFEVEIQNASQLQKIMKATLKIKAVKAIERLRSG